LPSWPPIPFKAAAAGSRDGPTSAGVAAVDAGAPMPLSSPAASVIA
jgi:hypothetical protein